MQKVRRRGLPNDDDDEAANNFEGPKMSASDIKDDSENDVSSSGSQRNGTLKPLLHVNRNTCSPTFAKRPDEHQRQPPGHNITVPPWGRNPQFPRSNSTPFVRPEAQSSRKRARRSGSEPDEYSDYNNELDTECSEKTGDTQIRGENQKTGGGFQNSAHKCQHCLKRKRYCDQKQPKCGACTQDGTRCYPQGVLAPPTWQNIEEKCWNCFYHQYVCRKAEGEPKCKRCTKAKLLCQPEPGPKMNRTLKEPLDVQDKDEKCAPCLKHNRRCNGEEPRCGTCTSRHLTCYKQGQPHPNPPRPHQPKLEKCGPCLEFNQYCDGVQPRCGVCLKKHKTCYDQKVARTYRNPQNKAEKCRGCVHSRSNCDGVQPTCGACKKRGKICLVQDGTEPPPRKRQRKGMAN